MSDTAVRPEAEPAEVRRRLNTLPDLTDRIFLGWARTSGVLSWS